MKILVFDTETISIDKPFCYNLGYTIVDTETRECVAKRDYVVEQIWNNKPLFATAYYEQKKDLYISALRGRRAKIKHWGHICQRMIRDIEENNIEYIYAFNSPFDIKVLDFMCDWFKNVNPLDYVKTIDIRALINPLVFSDEYKNYCIANGLTSGANNIKVNAEAITQYIRDDIDFNEEHTALSDSIIESEILFYMIDHYNIDITNEKKVYNTISTQEEQLLNITFNGDLIFSKPILTKRMSTATNTLVLKDRAYTEATKRKPKKKIEIEEE